MKDGTVCLVKSGDYEQRSVVMVAASWDVAVREIKARYGEPYRVTWEETGDGLRGRFERVPGYSTEHVADFDITEWEVYS